MRSLPIWGRHVRAMGMIARHCYDESVRWQILAMVVAGR